VNPLRWRLTYPPTTTNHMYVSVGHRRVLKAIAREWRDSIIARLRDGGAPTPPPGLLSIRIDLYPPDARKRDVDGPIKLAIDACAAALGFDDYRITLLTVRRHQPTRAARLEVELATDTEAMPVTAQSTHGGTK
jgi:crossover junction endodeoxyribonuclease RusA